MKTRLQIVDGLARLFVDDEQHCGIFCSTPSKFMQNFIDAGFDIFDTHPLTPHGWIAPDTYDYTATDEYIEKYLSQKRDARLILRFWMGLSQGERWTEFWWSQQNPGETLKINKDPAKHVFRNRPSYASLKWRAEAGEALRRVVEHVEAKYGDNVVAYVPGCGPCGEWFHWFGYGAKDDGDLVLEDYSQPMRRRYQEYLQEKYSDIGNLNREWSARYDSYEQIPLPEAPLRINATWGHVRSAGNERPVIDFYEVFNRQVALTLTEWSRQVKEGCAGGKVVMNFYGYQWHHQEDVVQTRSGHNDLNLALECPDVDYIVAPFHYWFRQLEGVVSGQAPVAGAIRRGKQYVHELDGSTMLKPSWPCRGHHNPTTAEETGELFRRDLGKVMVEGSSCWYMDLTWGMYDHPALVEELRKTLAVGRKHAPLAGRNNRQVAAVLNPFDPYYHREAEPLLMSLLPAFKQFELERMGLGYDDLILDDLEHLAPEQTQQYKFWIFPSAAHLTDRQLELIRRHCLRNGNYVLWNYGVGVSNGDGLDLARMEAITGFRCGYTLEAGELAVTIRPGSHPLLKGLASPIVYGTYGDLSADHIKSHAALEQYHSSAQGFSISPRFHIEQCDEALGKVNDLPGQPAGLGIRQMGQWTSILSVAPLVPKAILRNIARAAGCHVFTDFLGQTYQSENYLGMYFHADGPCRIRLPFPAKVTDIVREETLAQRAEELTVEARMNHTLLLRYE